MRKRIFLFCIVVTVIISAGVYVGTLHIASNTPGPGAVAVASNTEDTPLRVSFSGGDLVAAESDFALVLKSEWPAGTQMPPGAMKGDLVDLNKAGQIKWLSGNLISLDLSGVRREIWVSVPAQGGAIRGNGQYGRPIQTVPGGGRVSSSRLPPMHLTCFHRPIWPTCRWSHRRP